MEVSTSLMEPCVADTAHPDRREFLRERVTSQRKILGVGSRQTAVTPAPTFDL